MELNFEEEENKQNKFVCELSTLLSIVLFVFLKFEFFIVIYLTQPNLMQSSTVPEEVIFQKIASIRR